MAKLRFSGRAKTDLTNIGSYSPRSWGEQQTVHYLEALEDCAKMLARNPGIGRPCDWIRPGIFRFEQGRHVIFYRREKRGILIVRFLHQSMLPDWRSFEDANSKE
jgi:toxin ParE1/3/4